MAKKTRVGVIGIGHLGQHHARIYSALPHAQLVGVADIDKSRAETIARRYNTQAFTDHHDLMERVDAVSVVVPTSHHHQIAKDFINWGIDVLVEKPFTTTLAEAEELQKLAEERAIILQVGHSERFNPAVMSLSKEVKNPLFLEVHRLGPFAARGLDVDVVLDLMIHDLDIVMDLVASPLKQINASGVPVLSQQVDIASTRLEFENGCVANITCSRVSAEQLRKLRIFQPAKYISLDYIKQQLSTVSLIPTQEPEKSKTNFSLEQRNIEITPQEPLKAELEAFLDCATTRSQPLVSGKEGYRALKLAMEVKQQILANLQQHLARSGLGATGPAGSASFLQNK